MATKEEQSSPLQETVDSALERYRQEINFARAFRRPTPLSGCLLALLGAIYLAVWILDAGWVRPATGHEGLAFVVGAKINPLVWQGQWWRLISCTLLHGNLLHLLFNGYAVFILGPLIERFYGPQRFFLLYTLSAVAASAASLWFTAIPSVGASGAIFGLLGALVVFGLKFRRQVPPRVAKAFGYGLVPWVVINLIIGLLPGLPIDNAAHVGGLVAGILIALVMSSELMGRPGRLRVLLLEVGLVVCLMAFAWGLVMMFQQVVTCSKGGVSFYQCYPPEMLGL